MRRSPVLHWLFTFLTLGVYGFWWLCLMAREVTALGGGDVVTVHKRTRLFFGGAVVYYAIILGFACIGVSDRQSPTLMPLMLVACALGFALQCSLFYLPIYVARRLRRISGDSAPGSATAVILTCCLFFLGLPYLQIYLNDQLVRNSRAV